MLRTFSFCLLSLILVGILTGCLATKAVTTTVGVATKATVLTVKTTAKVATGTAGLVIPDGDDEGNENADDN